MSRLHRTLFLLFSSPLIAGIVAPGDDSGRQAIIALVWICAGFVLMPNDR